MAKEVRVIAYCDGEHEHRVEADTERRETLDGEPFVLDLCHACETEFDAALSSVRKWLGRGVPVAMTQQPKKKGRRPKDLTTACNQCDYVGATRGALGQHLHAKHNMGIKEAGL